jgi:methylmalonyl-CoA/ethylmalonyl-CoA epimerase
MPGAPTSDPADLGPRLGLHDLLLGVDHVGIAVAELEPALAWWTGTLGLVVAHREENHDQQVVEVMLASGPGTTGATTQLQLLAPLSDASAVARFLVRRGPGLQHVAFVVADLTLASARLTARGGRLLYPEGRTGTSGSKINFIHPRDAGGVLVELVEPSSFPGIAGRD